MSVKGVYTVYTIESLMAMTEEVGECRHWTGYVGNKTPQVYHEGKMHSVRRLLFALSGDPIKKGHYAVPTCGDRLCVCQKHTIKRDANVHRRMIAKKSSASIARTVKIATLRREHHAKINMEIANEIRGSGETGKVLGARYGISSEMVNQIKRGDAWKDYSSPFAGLGAR